MGEDLKTDEIFSDLLPRLIDENPDVVQKIRSIISFTLTGKDEKSWTIDLLGNPGVRFGIEDGTKCRIKIDNDVFESLIKQNKIKPWLDAYKSKDIVVKGHLPTIIKLERLAGKLVKDS